MAKLTGIRSHRGAYEVRWTGADGRPRTKRFPLDTPESELVRFREKEVAKVTLAEPIAARGVFEYERDQFLASMKEGSKRRRDFAYQLAGWESHLKGQRLHGITTERINNVLRQWQLDGKANATLMRQRSALMSLFTLRASDLKPNPVMEALSFKVSQPKPRAVDLGTLGAIFAKMPKCATKARQMMVFYFGARPSEVMRLRPADIVVQGENAHVFLRSSDDDADGKGTNDRIIAIVSDAMREAAMMFIETRAFGVYSTAAARTSFLLAARKAGLTDNDLIEGESRNGKKRYRIRPYDLRHTFATELRKVADLRDVQDALGHQNATTTARYAPRQNDKVTAALGRSAINGVAPNFMAQVAALSPEQRAALLATLQGA